MTWMGGFTTEVSKPPISLLENRAGRLAALGALPLAIWWLGWFPGFGSTDTVDQLGQAASNQYLNHHPPIHTLLLDLSWTVLGSPGYLGLAQVLIMGLLLAVVARRQTRLGVPMWWSIAAAWVVGLLPAVGATTSALWKDVPFALALLWVFAEMLLLIDPRHSWSSMWAPVRLAIGLASVWLFRQNGLLTVLALLVVIALLVRSQIWKVVAPLLASVLIVTGVLYPLLGVESEGVSRVEVFIPDVAAVLINRPLVFTAMHLATIESIAPREVWTGSYRCDDSSPLAFNPSFNLAALRDQTEAFREVVLRSVAGAPGTVLQHRWCSGSFVVWPFTPEGGHLHRPPFAFPPNTLGITRAPIAQWASAVTTPIYVWAEADHRLWYTWSPAIPIVTAVGVYAGLALRPRSRRWAIPGWVLLIHGLNVIWTSPSHEFRYAFPLYLIAVLSLPLAAGFRQVENADMATLTPQP